MTSYFRRGDYALLVGGMTVVWPLAARAPRAERDLSTTGRSVNRANDLTCSLEDPGARNAAVLGAQKDSEAAAFKPV